MRNCSPVVSSRKLPCGESANSGKKYAPWDCSALVCKRFRKVTLQRLQTQVKISTNSLHIITKTRHELLGEKKVIHFQAQYFWVDTLLQRSVMRICQMLTGSKTNYDASIVESSELSIKQKDTISGLWTITAQRCCEKHTVKATLSYTSSLHTSLVSYWLLQITGFWVNRVYIIDSKYICIYIVYILTGICKDIES